MRYKRIILREIKRINHSSDDTPPYATQQAQTRFCNDYPLHKWDSKDQNDCRHEFLKVNLNKGGYTIVTDIRQHLHMQWLMKPQNAMPLMWLRYTYTDSYFLYGWLEGIEMHLFLFNLSY